MKKKIIIKEKNIGGLSSKLTLKTKNNIRKFTLRNYGDSWTIDNEKRCTLILDNDGNVTIETSRGNYFEMDLLELCDIADICDHFSSLGENIRSRTKAIK